MRLEETVETLAKQHIRLERACEKEKGKEMKQSMTGGELASPTIKTSMLENLQDLHDKRHGDGEGIDSDEEDEFEDAVSDLPSGGGMDEGDSGRSALQSHAALVKSDSMKRSSSEQGLITQRQAPAESTHRRWMSEDIQTSVGL